MVLSSQTLDFRGAFCWESWWTMSVSRAASGSGSATIAIIRMKEEKQSHGTSGHGHPWHFLWLILLWLWAILGNGGYGWTILSRGAMIVNDSGWWCFMNSQWWLLSGSPKPRCMEAATEMAGFTWWKYWFLTSRWVSQRIMNSQWFMTNHWLTIGYCSWWVDNGSSFFIELP